jgi:hypothetical protein
MECRTGSKQHVRDELVHEGREGAVLAHQNHELTSEATIGPVICYSLFGRAGAAWSRK